MKKVRASGILLFSKKMKYFLLMKHPSRWDLPKGHLELGEDYFQGALREFEEETGINKDEISLIEGFSFEETYYPIDKNYGNEKVEKSLVIFIAKLKKSKKKTLIKLTEHNGFEWIKWNPPHKIQNYTIDPLLKAVAKHLNK